MSCGSVWSAKIANYCFITYIEDLIAESPIVKQLFISLGLVSLFLCGSCEKEKPLSTEAAALKLLISENINTIEDLIVYMK
jgi:hypothetical protein